ncbi:DMT family transporter [Parasulfitobacter algicola]|uniref:DMT family transporter n=1 Tax=Parasulfitobacter algicola TaxID=2614809 RepID=A0ABX2IRB9_9RHOB|nr:DMT family transporter [Sulfitobacter algicola]NSX54890.1 DMT family transporter [Sulfitobacter algicola]
MRLILLTTLTMIAFAANSVLNRMALADGTMGPSSFAIFRLLSGAVMLVVLVWLTSGNQKSKLPFSITGAATLALYVIGFSFAYVTLDAGVGALILFGGVQITMFIGALLLREAIPPLRWIGAILAFTGLIYLMWPAGADVPSMTGSILMAAAAFGWGIYSLAGRGAKAPLNMTAANFLLAVPLGALAFLLVPSQITLAGTILALISGAVTSGLGYALWYSILPQLGATRAAVSQLTVPIIALGGGILLLDETLTWRFAVATLLVLGGVTLSLIKSRA